MGEKLDKSDFEDIQAIVLNERPSPYIGAYILIRIDEKKDAIKMLQTIISDITAAEYEKSTFMDLWVNIAFTYEGLKKIGVTEEYLNSFSAEFKEGMASRANILNDVANSAPNTWDISFGTKDIHIALVLFAANNTLFQELMKKTRAKYEHLSGVSILYEQKVESLPNGRTHMGFVDGISNPTIEGLVSDSEKPVKAGEFLLGKLDEKGHINLEPQFESLHNNGSYLVIRKLHMNVGAFRKYIKTNSINKMEKELLIAKMVGRWSSGVPLSLSPDKDNFKLNGDVKLRNDFSYGNDLKGLKCPLSAHIRRANPRDGLKDSTVDINIHRILRRSTVYGPPLGEEVLEDDGQDRGIIFAGICTSISRQYEFIKSNWLNTGNFIELSTEEDPIVGNKMGLGQYTIPNKPIRNRLFNLPNFTITRGGEYFFVPSISALNWLLQLND
ncbi:peroxidase [Bacillus toyonensis]|uniref:Dyp-type peroxidase n=1 Tax=Bacillus toyonensis TaxID=155322 RepID=UPI000BFA23A6|nr:Dyp-type peroxidase [Bacillus toyonensis]PFZ67186.1 peroxidase [Bacillus toyonensis]